MPKQFAGVITVQYQKQSLAFGFYDEIQTSPLVHQMKKRRFPKRRNPLLAIVRCE